MWYTLWSILKKWCYKKIYLEKGQNCIPKQIILSTAKIMARDDLYNNWLYKV